MDVAEGIEYSMVMYTGGLENCPEIIRYFEQKSKVIGTSSTALAVVRDPFRLADLCAQEGIRFPDVERDGEPSSGNWLRKPLRSCGGTSIKHVKSSDKLRVPFEPDHPCGDDSPTYFLQRFVDGSSFSALYIADNHETLLIDVHEQLIGCSDFGASGFQFSGAIRRNGVPSMVLAKLQQIGEMLRRRCKILGLVGIDFVLSPDAQVVLIEVNPRWTATAELSERALGISLTKIQIETCDQGRLPVEVKANAMRLQTEVVGKAIIYSTSNLDYQVSREAQARLIGLNNDRFWPLVADIPPRSTIIRPGQPICTLFARGRHRAQVRRKLNCLARFVQKQFGGDRGCERCSN